MSSHSYHRGIGFLVRGLGAGRWQWIVEPPQSVRGLQRKTGEVLGEHADAVEAAKREIEVQEQAIS